MLVVYVNINLYIENFQSSYQADNIHTKYYNNDNIDIFKIDANLAMHFIER